MMKSNFDDNLDEKYKKRTAFVWKVFWFFVDLVGIPLIIATITYFIVNYIFGSFIAISIAILTYICASLIFYRHCDKFRNSPFFANQQNNLKARINALFLITILSLAIAPIFVFFTSEDYVFYVFPIISFTVLYNIVWFYYFYKPIDFYNASEGVFKNAVDIKLTIKQLYNLIVIFNYIVQIIFLSITYDAKYSFVFILSLAYTRNQRKRIQDAINENARFLIDLINFKKRIVNLINSLSFSVLVQIPFLFIVTKLNNINLVIMGSCALVIFLTIYIKTTFYLYFHYNSILSAVTENDSSKEEIRKKDETYQKYNSYLSGIFVAISAGFSFIAKVPVLILVIAPFIYVLLYFEEKKAFCNKKTNRIFNFGNSFAVLLAISFGILVNFSWNIQVIVLLLSLYFILEIYVKIAYFKKKDIRVIQNGLAVSVFFLIVNTLIFPLISGSYILTGNDFQSGLLLIILNSAWLLFSFYVFFIRKGERSNVLNFCLMSTFLVIESLILILINSRNSTIFL